MYHQAVIGKCYPFSDLSTVKTKHILVPQYKLLPEEEIQQLERKFGKRALFNKMLAKKDAMARYLDLRTDDVVEVTRKSVIGGFSVGYRILIECEEN